MQIFTQGAAQGDDKERCAKQRAGSRRIQRPIKDTAGVEGNANEHLKQDAESSACKTKAADDKQRGFWQVAEKRDGGGCKQPQDADHRESKA